MDNQRLISDIVKEYPDMIKVYIYHNNYLLEKPLKSKKKSQSQIDHDNQSRSLRRSQVAVRDIILSNRFDLWCTFTFDSTKHDRYDISRCRYVMTMWLHNQKKNHSPKLEYLVVPELHKDGAIHFHALLKNFNGKLKPAHHPKSKKPLTTKKGQQIFNATGYRSGHTEFVYIDSNYEALSKYMIKQYITKDMLTFKGSQRYLVSNGLTRPRVTVNGLAMYGLQNLVKGNVPESINQYFEVQTFAKSNGTIWQTNGQTQIVDTEEYTEVTLPKSKLRQLVTFAH